MQELVDRIKLYRQQYWGTGVSEIADSEYEALLDILRSQDPNHELLSGIEETLINTERKIKHKTPMLSLLKVFTFEDISKWTIKVARDGDEQFSVEPKLDGLSGKYYYETKTLATRGNGEFGENITDKLPILNLISNRFKTFGEVTEDLIGEIVISYANFDKVNLTATKKYATPCSLAAGVINSNDLLDIRLDFVEYDYVAHYIAAKELQEDILSYTMLQYKDYPLDGIVIKLKDKEYSKSLGSTNHHPKGALAWKPKDEVVETTLIDVILQPGKNKFTPVGIIKPTVIDGVTINRVSLHNAKRLIDNDVHINDFIYIIRSGGVIPYAVMFKPNINERQKLVFSSCEFCGSDLVYEEPELYCSNAICPGNTKIQLLTAVKSLGIENLGLPTIEKMIETLGVETIYDIITLDVADILMLEGFKDTSATKLFENFNSIMDGIEDYKLIAALNIPGIGAGLLKPLMSKLNIEQLLSTPYHDLITYDNISDQRATSIIDGLNKNTGLLSKLLDVIQVIESKSHAKESILKQTICFSGTFPNPKQHYYNIAQQKGYEIVDSVTGKLDILVTAGSVTSKVDKARKNGHTRVIPLVDFLK